MHGSIFPNFIKAEQCAPRYGVLLSGERSGIMAVLELGRCLSILINLTAKAFFFFLYAVTHCGEFTSVILINDVPEAYLVCVSSIIVPF